MDFTLNMCHSFLLAVLGKVALYFPLRTRYIPPNTAGNSPKYIFVCLRTLGQGIFYLSLFNFYMTMWIKHWQGKKHLSLSFYNKCNVLFYFGQDLIYQSYWTKQTLNQNLSWSGKAARYWISSAELVKLTLAMTRSISHTFSLTSNCPTSSSSVLTVLYEDKFGSDFQQVNWRK